MIFKIAPGNHANALTCALTISRGRIMKAVEMFSCRHAPSKKKIFLKINTPILLNNPVEDVWYQTVV